MRRKTKPILLVVEPDEHYISDVARVAVRKGLVSNFIAVKRADFANVLDKQDKSNLIIAKGMLETADFLRLILRYNDRELLTRDGFLSHCSILMRHGRHPFILTDGAANIKPDVKRKFKIVKNAINFARKMFGIKRPILSILTPSGKLNPGIQSSVDGDIIIKKLLDEGENVEARLDQFDTATSVKSRKVKKIPGKKMADILLAHDLDSANIIWKVYMTSLKCNIIGIVCGTTVPIALSSRADTEKSKLLSIKYAIKLLRT